MLLLSGPAAATTRHILDEVRQALGRGASNIRLITPTATMAEHLRHLLAREGFAFRPELVTTLSKFVAGCAGDLPEVSPPLLHLIVEAALQRLRPPEFEQVALAPGFIATITRTVDELSTAGCSAETLWRALPDAPFARPFARVYQEVERELARRGLGMRAARLARAAERIAAEGISGVDTVWMDGFFKLAGPELELVRAIASQADLTVVAPEAREALLAAGFDERRVEAPHRARVIRAFRAPSIDREAEEIARRILEETAAGREFRECGVLVRNRAMYAAPLRAALERFGIPARFYFTTPLDEHPLIRRIAGAVAALRAEWDWQATLTALRYAADSEELDRFDFAVRARMPHKGLAALREIAPEGVRPALDQLASIDWWRTAAQLPEQWSKRIATLRRLAPEPRLTGLDSYETALRVRSDARALAAFDTALEQAARFFDPARRIGFDDFWTAAETVIRQTALRVPDLRRNVVHVMSVYEARQWELPCVFLCGLAEQQFPRRESQDPIFPDPARSQLALSGIRIRTAAQRELEELFLFQLAQAAASAILTLSYPEADARGVRVLPSPFLAGQDPPLCTAQVRPEPAAEVRPPEAAPLVGVAPPHFSASGLECFLGCPFQHFARNTLRLQTRPLGPQERLDFKLQGTIVHRTIAEWHKNPQPVLPLFESVFAAACREYFVFPGYRAESLRRQMRDDLTRFAESTELRPISAVSEHPFLIEIEQGLPLKGRIDRIDRLPDGRALIVDYKYSGKQGVAGRMEGEQYLQAALYAIAVERDLGLEPAGFFYYGLKTGSKIDGWSNPPGLFGVDSNPLTPEWISSSLARAREAAAQIRAGVIAPDPADAEICRLCDYNDICRFKVGRTSRSARVPQDPLSSPAATTASQQPDPLK